MLLSFTYCQTSPMIFVLNILLADSMIKKFEESVSAYRLETESLNSKLGEVHLELSTKESDIKLLLVAQEGLEKDKIDLQMSNDEFSKKLVLSHQEIEGLKSFVHMMASQLAELDKQNLSFVEKFNQLNSLYDSCFMLVQQERDIAIECAKQQYEQLHDKFLCVMSEKEASVLINRELSDKMIALQKEQNSVMVQLSEERSLATERIRNLEVEAEALVSKKTETELLVCKLEKEIDTLSESSRLYEKKMVCKLLSCLCLSILIGMFPFLKPAF